MLGKLDATNSSSGSWDTTCQEKQQHTRNKTRIIRGSANTAYVHRAHQIYYYITLNELQIVDQQISLTQCISHTLEKYTLCVFAHSLRKILQLYFSCSLEGTLSLLSHLPCSSLSLRSSHFFMFFSLIRSSQFIGIGEAPIHDEREHEAPIHDEREHEAPIHDEREHEAPIHDEK
jgi:hypothetical protein